MYPISFSLLFAYILHGEIIKHITYCIATNTTEFKRLLTHLEEIAGSYW